MCENPKELGACSAPLRSVSLSKRACSGLAHPVSSGKASQVEKVLVFLLRTQALLLTQTPLDASRCRKARLGKDEGPDGKSREGLTRNPFTQRTTP